MRINAKTIYGKKVFILQFVVHYPNYVWAVTVDGGGNIKEYPIEDLTIIDGQYLR